jgi:DNA polymerase I
MMFQPEPGVYENVDEIDFTSMYPSIIVNANLSPETIADPDGSPPGFLPVALEPLLALRVAAKARKKADPSIAGIDAVLKWMLVTCFGYTGYRNAKFGRIEVHEAITGRSREILLAAKATAEAGGFTVLHGNVDCLWVQGSPVAALREAIARQSDIPCEVEHFDWIVFLPQKDGTGAYTRYFGRLPDGSVKVRGIAARRHDTPAYVREMQAAVLAVMGREATMTGLATHRNEAHRIYRNALDRLPSAPVEAMVIGRRISRLNYTHRCIEGAAVDAYRNSGTPVAPGMKIRYVVRDARSYIADPAWCATGFDVPYYRQLLEKAWEEMAFGFRAARGEEGPACVVAGGPGAGKRCMRAVGEVSGRLWPEENT